MIAYVLSQIKKKTLLLSIPYLTQTISIFRRFDDQKSFVEDYQDWKDNVGELKPFLDNTKKEMDACELPTSDHSVREKQAQFIKVCFVKYLTMTVRCMPNDGLVFAAIAVQAIFFKDVLYSRTELKVLNSAL